MFPDGLRDALFGALAEAFRKFLSRLLALVLAVVGCVIAYRWLRALLAAAVVSGVALLLARGF